MCKFCDDYCLVKYLHSKHDIPEGNEHRFYASLVSVSWNKNLRRPQGTSTHRMRKLKYCPSCGIRFGSKEFHKYYSEFFKKTLS